MERIVLELTEEDFKKVLEKKDGLTWRELILPALGIDTKRVTPGPDRKNA